jgi:hypothetical protein
MRKRLHEPEHRRVRRSIVALAAPLLIGFSIPLAHQPCRAESSVGSVGAHWGGQLSPQKLPGTSAELATLLLSEYGQLPEGADTSTRRGTQLLAQPYGALDTTYTPVYGTIRYTTYMPIDRLRRSPDLLYTAALSLGAYWDAFGSFFQNQFVHNLRGIPAVARDGDVQTGPYLSGGLEVTYLLDDGSPVPPFFVSAGGTTGTLFNDLYAQVGVSDFRPFRYWQDMRVAGPAVNGVTLHMILRSGFVARELLPWVQLGLPASKLRESYAMFQTGVGWERDGVFAFRASFTGTTGIFLIRNEIHADREVPIPENYLSLLLRIGGFHFEFVNDLAGNKDRGPSYGARMGHRWH